MICAPRFADEPRARRTSPRRPRRFRPHRGVDLRPPASEPIRNLPSPADEPAPEERPFGADEVGVRRERDATADRRGGCSAHALVRRARIGRRGNCYLCRCGLAPGCDAPQQAHRRPRSKSPRYAPLKERTPVRVAWARSTICEVRGDGLQGRRPGDLSCEVFRAQAHARAETWPYHYTRDQVAGGRPPSGGPAGMTPSSTRRALCKSEAGESSTAPSRARKRSTRSARAGGERTNAYGIGS